MNIEEYARQIEEIISSPEYKPLYPSDMMNLLGISPEDEMPFEALVREMARAGDIALTKKGKIAPVSSVGIISGVFRGTSKSFGFVTPDDGGEDIFIPAKKTAFALDGDKVLAKKTDRDNRGHKHYDRDKLKRGRDGKLYPVKNEARKGPEGEVVLIKERRLEKESVVGIYYEMTEKRGRRYYPIGFVNPDSKKLPYSVFVSPTEAEKLGVKSGDKVEIRITRFPSEKSELCGEILRNFGASHTKQANYAAILAENGIETEFDADVIEESDRLAARSIEIGDRRDLRDAVIFTIDGADAKDLDDAISLERIGEKYRLGVHIADVSEYVREGSLTDRCAMRRGTSVYFTDKVVPMLPRSLSNGACSLGGGLDRYALSAFMTLDSEGNILETELCETVIRSRVRGVYSEVNDIFLNGERSEFAEKYASVMPTLAEMLGLYKILKKRSESRGAVELDTEEAVILLDKNGIPVDICARERGDAERMIEQFMLSANEGVATFLTDMSMPCVYRVHEPPSPDKLENFISFAVGMGLDVRPLRTKKLYPSAFSAVLRESRKRNISAVLSSVMLRAMMKAKYSPRPEPHFGLAIDLYCHFTSPIRRYPDLSVHRIVKAVLHGEAMGERLSKLSGFAGESAVRSSENELKALSAEREIDDLYKAIFMKDKIGEEFDGIISSVTSFGLFVQLPNTIEGLVPIESLDGRFSFDEKNLILSFGRTSYRLGQSVRVLISDVDIPSRRITMEFVDPDI